MFIECSCFFTFLFKNRAFLSYLYPSISFKFRCDRLCLIRKDTHNVPVPVASSKAELKVSEFCPKWQLIMKTTNYKIRSQIY